MADAIYEVNIKLDAQQFEQELNQLKGKLKKFEKEAKERNKKDPIFRRGRELTVLKSIESTKENIPQNISFVRVNKSSGEVDIDSKENFYFELFLDENIN